MAPRKRNPENKGLPLRWCYQHGAYYYQVPPGLEMQWDAKRKFKLGRTLPDAYTVWAQRIPGSREARTVGELLDRYAAEVVPAKAPKTQQSNIPAIKRLKAVFGHMPLETLKPKHVYQYLDKRGARVAAKREIEVLSHTYTKAIEWGLIEAHPIKGKVIRAGTPPRTRYVEDWEIVEALSVAGPVLRAYISIKLLTGLRRADLLGLRMADIREDGIHVAPRKTAKTTGKRLIIEWSQSLRAAVEAALAARPKDIAPWLFCTRRGESYVKADGTANGWDSLWQRFMTKVMANTKVKERFTEHDLRAKCASDAPSLERARQLLAHADAALTRLVYRRKPERVKPAQ
ncbi:MAG: tyrosine-type recombinase/integrase [Pseudomonadota bacterium]|nr:tyrosine-type recombinase/integrase [Pseudomonadota bacterium]